MSSPAPEAWLPRGRGLPRPRRSGGPPVLIRVSTTAQARCPRAGASVIAAEHARLSESRVLHPGRTQKVRQHHPPQGWWLLGEGRQHLAIVHKWKSVGAGSPHSYSFKRYHVRRATLAHIVSSASCNSITCSATSADNAEEALSPLDVTPAFSSTGLHAYFSLPPVRACHMHGVEPYMVHGGHFTLSMVSPRIVCVVKLSSFLG